jgi:glycerophosphoryl diester phosphodiesterase
VLHDPSLLRTTGDPQRIARIPLAALATIDPVRRPLTFEAVLDRYGSSTRWLVELKGSTPSWESRVADLIAERGLADRAVVQSFDPFALLRLRRRAPAITVAPLFRRAPGAARLRSIAGFAAAIGVCHAAVETLLVSRAHACGLGVRAWTANTPADLERLVAIGVDGVITDAPDVARRLVDAGPLRAAA